MSTVSLIADIGWVWEDITGTEDYKTGSAQQTLQLARAGKGARIGTRAGRIARIIRMVRLIRIVKLYKNAKIAIAAKEEQAIKLHN